MSETKSSIKNIITSVILIITILLSAFSAYAESFRISYYISSNGEYLLSSVEGSMSTFDLEWLENADKYTSIETGAFSKCTSLTTISIPETYYIIKEYAVGYIYSDGDYKKVTGFTIKGKTNSAAYDYAMDNGFKFISTGIVAQDTVHTIIPDENGYVHSGLKSLSKLTKGQIAGLIESQSVSNPYESYISAPSVTSPYSLGKVRNDIISAGLERFNDYRRLAGLTDVSINDDYTVYAQAASVVNAANNYMTHYPTCPKDMSSDFYDTGYYGAGHSNLVHYSGYETPYGSLSYSVDLWMYDSDNSNIAELGHRRWFLNPAMSQTGFGCANNGRDIHTTAYSMDTSGEIGDYDFISWPASGYMPSDTEFFTEECAWSITINPTKMNTWDYSNVTVTLTSEEDGNVWNFTNVKNNKDGFFTVNNDAYAISNCIIFRPSCIDDYEGVYTVTVNGLKDLHNKAASLSFQVEFFETDDIESEEITTETTTTPSTIPTTTPTTIPTTTPTTVPTTVPTTAPTTIPTTVPTTVPTTIPTTATTEPPAVTTTKPAITTTDAPEPDSEETTTVSTTESTTEPTTKADSVQGDLNGDDKITAADARIALRAASKIMTLEDDVLVLADMNGDGKLNAADARIILRIASKLDVYTKPEATTTAKEETATAEITTAEKETTSAETTVYSTTALSISSETTTAVTTTQQATTTQMLTTVEPSKDKAVVIMATGTQYHDLACVLLGDEEIFAISLSEAKNKGYTACEICCNKQ